MTEKERFTTTICDECRHILKDRDSNLSVTLRGVCHKEELALLDTLNNLHKENEGLQEENEKLKNNLKEIGYEFKKYSYEETGKKIEDYNTEELLISLLQDIINELQTDWIVANCNSDFTNDLDLRTNKVVEKNISMDIRLRRHSNWLMIGQNK